MLLLIIFEIVNTQTIPKPQLHIEKLPYEQYTLITKEERTLYEDEDCFQISLWRKISANHSNHYTNEILDQIAEEEQKLNEIPGCIGKEQSFNMQQHLRMNLAANNTVFYTDMIIVQNRAIIIRNDMILHEINLHEDKFIKTLIQKRIPLEQSLTSHPIMIRNQQIQRIYIISEKGGVSIPDWISLNEPIFYINQEPFLQRKIVYNAFNINNSIYVACGSQGIDIYQYNEGSLKHSQTITKIDGQPLIAMDINGNSKYLYVLDYNKGLIIFNYKYEIIFKIPIQKGSDFAYYENTFFIIAESQQGQDYAVEIFINFDDQSFYINQYYLDEMRFYDVRITKNYAILIGYEVHKIVQHSIYNEFIKYNNHYYFEFNQFLDYKEWDKYLIGLSKQEIRLMQLQQQLPKIVCYSTEEVSQNYLVQQYIKNKTSPYEGQLKYTIFTLNVKDVSLINQANLILLCIVLIILLISTIVIILGYFIYLKCIQKVDKLIEETRVLTQQIQQDKEEGSGQELTSI